MRIHFIPIFGHLKTNAAAIDQCGFWENAKITLQKMTRELGGSCAGDDKIKMQAKNRTKAMWAVGDSSGSEEGRDMRVL